MITIVSLGISNQFSKIEIQNIDMSTYFYSCYYNRLINRYTIATKLKKIKVGQIELDTAPIIQKGIELEPNISDPISKSVRISFKSIPGKLKPVLTLFQH